jgi:two-component sensor histidine kinase
VQELAELAESLGMQALTAMNKQALAKQSADKNRQGTDFRMNFGIFNFNSRTDATNGNSDDNLD